MPKLVFRLYAKDENFTKNMANAQKRLREQSTLFNNINRDGNRASKTMGSFGKALPVLKLTGAVMLMRQFSRAISTTANASMDAIETQNMFNVSLGQSAVETGKLVTTMSELYGLDATNIKNAVSTYGLLARSMGMTDEQAKSLSSSTYQLAVDLSSLTNVPIEQVLGDLRSGLLGQSETVYKYGMDVTEASLKVEAMNQGITKSVRNMSQGEKMALRYAVMIKTGAIAQGDFANTIEQPANQAKILQERMVSLSRAIGDLFMNSIGKVLPYVNAFVILLQRAVTAIGRLMGVVGLKDENTTNSIGGLAEDADLAEDNVNNTTKAIKKLRSTLLGFDELNIMNAPTENASSGGADISTTGSIIDTMEIDSFTSLLDGMPSKAQAIADKIQGIFANFWGNSGLSNFSFTELWETSLKAPFEMFLEWFNGDFLNPLLYFWEGIGIAWYSSFYSQLTALYAIFKTTLDGFISYLPSFLENFGVSWATILGILSAPIEAFLEISGSFWETIKEVWNTYGEDLVNNTFLFFDNIWKTINSFLLQYIVPVVNSAVQFMKDIWNDYLKDIVEKVATLVMELASGATEIYNEFISPIVNYLVNTLAPHFRAVFNGVLNIVKSVIGFVSGIISGLIEVLRGLIKFVVGIFTGDWKKAWEGIKQIFKGGYDAFTSIGSGVINVFKSILQFFKNIFVSQFKTSIQAVKDIIGGLDERAGQTMDAIKEIFGSVKEVIKAPLNGAIDLFNKMAGNFKIELPSWIPSIGGKSFKIPQIPKLATGGIVDSPTLSMIGEAGAEAVMPLNSNALQKYLAPILGNNKIDATEMYNAFYRALSDIERESESENIYNLYIDGSYDKTIREMRRKNVRSGRVIIPVGGN